MDGFVHNGAGKELELAQNPGLGLAPDLVLGPGLPAFKAHASQDLRPASGIRKKAHEQGELSCVNRRMVAVP